MKRNTTLTAVRNAIRHPYAWPGGYPIHIYLSDGEAICPDCARENYRAISTATRHADRDGWAAMGVDIYYEGPPEYCCQCNAAMESAYGDPETEE